MVRIALTAAGATLALVPASAGARWSAPATLTAGLPRVGEAAPQIATSRTGRTLAVWSPAIDHVILSVGDRRGRFSAPRVITRHGGSPQVAIAADGSALIGWTRGGRVYLASRSPGGRIRRARPISAAARRGIDGPHLAMAPGGEAVIAWTATGRIGVTWAVLRSAGGQVGAPQRLGAGRVDSFAANPVSIGAAGDAAVAFLAPAGAPASGNLLTVARRRAGAGSFQSAPAGAAPATEPALAVGNAGDVTAAWVEGLGFESDFDGPLKIAAAGAGAPFPAPVTGPAQRAFLPRVVSLGAGASTIAWQNRIHGTRPSLLNGPLSALTRHGDGTVGAPQTLDANVRARRPRLAPLRPSRALAVWTTTPRGSRRLIWRAALAGTDGRFHRVAAPRASAPSFTLGQELATGGHYAALIWQDGRRLRATVGHL